MDDLGILAYFFVMKFSWSHFAHDPSQCTLSPPLEMLYKKSLVMTSVSAEVLIQWVCNGGKGVELASVETGQEVYGQREDDGRVLLS